MRTKLASSPAPCGHVTLESVCTGLRQQLPQETALDGWFPFFDAHSCRQRLHLFLRFTIFTAAESQQLDFIKASELEADGL